MSKYTTEIRFICETAAGLTDSAGYRGINEVIQSAIPKVFDFDFPIYDESYRNVLCTKILKHYYTREIGLETVGLWKLHLDARLNEIMPYYNQLYKSAMIDFNPMYDVDLTTRYTKDNDGTTDTTNSITKNSEISNESTTEKTETRDNTIDDTRNIEKAGSLDDARNTITDVSSSQNGNSIDNKQGTDTNTQRNLYSDTPQGSLDNIENETYLTNARKITDSGENSSESTSEYSDSGESNQIVSDTLARVTNDTSDETYKRVGKDTVSGSVENNGKQTIKDNDENIGKTIIASTEEYLQTIQGKNGGISYSKMLQEFRATFVNIDVMIINELADLFMNIW